MSGNSILGVGSVVIVALLILALVASCEDDGPKYYHVPAVEVDIDKYEGSKPSYKAPAPKFNTRKR